MNTIATQPLPLHTVAADDVDPVTYEVVRHRLWNINIEHGNTIMRASGSPICVYGHDFNPCILTEDAEYVFYGPYLQFLSSASDSTAKWVMENRHPNPGIADGDIYLSNDPWIGATHQMDVTLLCPVFYEERLFCWVANTLHQTDVGGASPGSFCPDAEDVFQESTPIPPMKIVEGGSLRPDLEEVYLRRSRLPEFLALDLRAGISGNLIAKERIIEMIDRYGPAVVKGSMRRVIADAERVFEDRLLALPDGVWRERGYLEQSRRGDRGVYRVQLTLRKEGSELSFSNEGTDPQAGVLNCTTPGWRGGLINAVSLAFCYDLLYAIGGPLRKIRFEVEPGTLSSAEFPAAVSNAPAFVIQMIIGMAGNVLGRMMIRDEQQRRHIFTSSAASVSPIDTMSGVNQWGDPFAMLHLEIVAGGLGAFSYKDGVPTGGLIFDLNGRMPEAEDLEQTVPILYLYRREQIDSGGAGRWARGNGPVAAHVVHGVEEIHHLIAASGFAVPTAPGLFGGYPGGPNMVTQRKDTDVREWFGRGEMPSDIDQLAGVEHKPQPKDVGVVQTEVDVHEYQLSAGAGFGDPLLREPDRVAEDARLRYVSHGAAAETFGVVLADDGSVDAVATEARRAAIRSDRLGGRAPSPLAETDGDRVAEYLVLDDAGRIACRMCGQDICGERESPKDGLVRRDLPIRAAGPNFVDPATYIDAEVQLRQFSCPSCATLVDTEVALQGDPVLRDTELR